MAMEEVADGMLESPTLAQLVHNCRRWSEMARFSRCPGGRQRLVERATLGLCEVITFVVRNQINNRPLG